MQLVQIPIMNLLYPHTLNSLYWSFLLTDSPQRGWAHLNNVWVRFRSLRKVVTLSLESSDTCIKVQRLFKKTLNTYQGKALIKNNDDWGNSFSQEFIVVKRLGNKNLTL